MNKEGIIKVFSKNLFPVDPPLPDDFDDTPNEDRPEWQTEYLWDRPYIQTIEFSGSPKYKNQFFESWPDGKRFDVRCLDGGAWDRPTVWGMFANLEEALECCESGPAWRKPGHFEAE